MKKNLEEMKLPCFPICKGILTEEEKAKIKAEFAQVYAVKNDQVN
ncbi:hypothetical protein RI065_07580 [Mycoplasmatota bacterium zrk1]